MHISYGIQQVEALSDWQFACTSNFKLCEVSARALGPENNLRLSGYMRSSGSQGPSESSNLNHRAIVCSTTPHSPESRAGFPKGASGGTRIEVGQPSDRLIDAPGEILDLNPSAAVHIRTCERRRPTTMVELVDSWS